MRITKATEATQSPSIHVLGAVNFDVIATSDHFISGTSTPSQICSHLGGVGYNLFQGIDYKDKHFYTLVGDDFVAEMLFHHPLKSQIHYQTIPGKKSGAYIALMEQGKLLYGAADTTLFENSLDFSLLEQWSSEWKKNDWLLFDSNCHPNLIDVLLDMTKKMGIHTVFETVSMSKAKRSSQNLHDVFLITPTVEEAYALIGDAGGVGGEESDHLTLKLIPWLKERNISHCLITRGEEGLEWVTSMGDVELISPRNKLKIKNSNGAGDYLLTQIVSTFVTYPFAELSKSVIREIICQAMDKTEQFLILRQQ